MALCAELIAVISRLQAGTGKCTKRKYHPVQLKPVSLSSRNLPAAADFDWVQTTARDGKKADGEKQCLFWVGF